MNILSPAIFYASLKETFQCLFAPSKVSRMIGLYLIYWSNLVGNKFSRAHLDEEFVVKIRSENSIPEKNWLEQILFKKNQEKCLTSWGRNRFLSQQWAAAFTLAQRKLF